MIDLYVLNAEDDANFDPIRIEEADELGVYMNQIRNMFSADTGSIMGASDMTIGLEQLIYEMNVNEKALRTMIYDSLFRYCTLCDKFKTEINVAFAKGQERDICFIDIIIDDARKLQLRIF